MKFTPTETSLLIRSLSSRIVQLKAVIHEWESLPEDAMVNDLDRYAVAVAKEDIPNLSNLLAKLEGKPAPSDELVDVQFNLEYEGFEEGGFSAKYHPPTGQVSDIVLPNKFEFGNPIREYIILPDGRELTVVFYANDRWFVIPD